MKEMYTKNINFGGHYRFMKMLYFIESEKGLIDFTEKKHSFNIQGNKISRDRKFDPERMKQVLDERILKIDSQYGEDFENP